jgi:hypothetical protein
MKFAPVAITILGLLVTEAAPAPPTFKVDASWPKTLPNDWILGQVAGIAVDAQDHIWITQRPNSLTNEEKSAALTPPIAKCCKPAPPVMEFDPSGTLLQAWGGPGKGYEWPQNEHGAYVDANGFFWIGGNGANDGQVLKFTRDGKFVLQIGKAGPQTGSADTTRLGRPASVAVDTAANEVYVADGYFDRRVIVFDATTGAFKRMWGAYGKPPVDGPMPEYKPGAPASSQFGLVHCVRLARDGLVYVCDRTNNRYQVFRKDGAFVKEVVVSRDTLGQGSMWDLAFWPDAGQTMLLNVDGASAEIRVLSRDTGAVLGVFGRNGRQAGEFHWVHAVAVDSLGEVFTAEVDTGKRIQKFVPDRPPGR